jgi:Spy/CpxP family protein refolding chaperone
MKSTTLIATLLAGAALAVACTSKDTEWAVWPSAGESPATNLDKAKGETKEAVQAMREYAYADKAEFAAKMRKELVSTQEEMDRLGAKVDKAAGVAKLDAKVRLAAAREKWYQAQRLLDQAETSTESNWDEAKNGYKRSYADLKVSFDAARQRLSETIAP